LEKLVMRCILPFLLVLAAACGPKSSGPNVPPRDHDTSAVIDWSLGVQHRAPKPQSSDVYLLLVPVRKPLESGVKVTPGCFDASSFMPAGDARVFFVSSGGLLVRDAPGKTPIPLQRQDPALRVMRLLAFVAAASPLEILVTAKPTGSAREQIWVLTVDQSSVMGMRPARGDRSLRDKAAFFEKYRAPHCQKGGERCLILSVDHEQAYLDVQPVRDANPEEFQALGDVDARDVAWADEKGEAIYLMMGCPNQAQ
jgi:hypothetical protein